MRPRIALIGGLLAAGLVLAYWPCQPRAAATEWVPFVAKQSAKVIQHTLTGEDKVLQETTGVYLRDRRGSIYSRGLSVVGEPSGAGLAILDDVRTGATYRIHYAEKKVYARRREMPQPTTEAMFRQIHPQGTSIGKKTVSGVECEEYSVPSKDPSGPPATMCFAPSMNFLPLEAKFPEPTQNAEVVMRLEGIEYGREPDPTLFVVPEGFEVVWQED
jgi:hypothetical protein